MEDVRAVPVLGGNSVGNLSTELLVLHHEDLKFLQVVDQNLQYRN